jgi:AraC-like DNA-binding protein
MEKMLISEKAINSHFHIGNILCTLITVLPFQHFTSTGRKYYEHHHHHFELHIVKQGECSFLCNNHTVSIDSTKILLLPLQIYHKEVHSTHDCQRMSLSFNLKLEPNSNDRESLFYYNAFHKMHQPVLVSNTLALKNLFDTISSLTDAEDRSFLEQEKMRTACHAVLIELFDAIADKEQLIAAERQAPTLPLEYTIDNFFANHYMDSSAKEKLAELLHVSTRQLHRILMDHYGKNYREKLNEARLKIAAGFLSDTGMSIAEISEKMGYSTPENFATFVKNETGLTPGQIRRNGFPASINRNK